MDSFDIRERISNGYYRNPVEYPSRPKKPMTVDPATTSLEEFVAYKLKLEAYELELEELNRRKKEWGEAESKMLESFKTDAIVYCGLEGHPKADKAWYLAWERGHSNGFMDVLYYLEELSDLLVDY